MSVLLDTNTLATWPATLALVVRAETDEEHEWAAAKALRVLRDLGARGERMLVVELCADRPRLARLLRVPPAPGIAEVLDGETTIPAAARRPEGEPFAFIGPGKRRAAAVTADCAWAAIAERMKAAGARLVLYCRAEDWPATGVPGIEGAVVFDAGTGGPPPGGVKMLAQLVAPATLRGLPAAPPPVAESPVLVRRRARPRMPVLGAILLAALGTGLVWWLASAGPGSGGGSAERVATAAAAGPPAIDVAAARHLPYSVQVESYSALADALRRERQLAGSLQAPVFIAAAAVDDILYYRVYAGLLAEPESAQALLRELVRRGVKDTVRVSDVRTLPWSFDLGLYPEREAAERRRRELVELGVPGYIVEVPTTAGVGYRLYVGGYENATEARVMTATLERNGVRVPLVQRIGS